MKTRTIIGLALAMALCVVPLSALAQGDETKWEDYTSKDELLTLQYPEGWFVSEPAEGDTFPTVGILNSEEAVTRFEEGSDLEAGDKGFSVIVLPLGFLGLVGVELPEDASVLEVGQAMSGLFNQPDEGASAEEIAAMEVGEPEEVDLAEDVPAVTISFKDLGVEGEYIVRLLENELVAVVINAAAPGEFDDAQRDLGREVAASVAYAGTGEDLLAAIMAPPAPAPTEAGPAPTEAAPEDSGATLDGEALVAERCTVCHTRERIDAADKDEAGWTATVDRMIGHGAQLNADERQAVIDYLVETH